MVEMPAFPGTEKQMHGVLQRFDEVGADGVNLLEFTYPMWNWEVYEALGLALATLPTAWPTITCTPARLPWTAAKSFAFGSCCGRMTAGLGLRMHYCSLENKHRAQIRNSTNRMPDINTCHAFDHDDFFLKTGVVFGADRAPVRAVLGAGVHRASGRRRARRDVVPSAVAVCGVAHARTWREVGPCSRACPQASWSKRTGPPCFANSRSNRSPTCRSCAARRRHVGGDEAAGTLQSF